MMLCRIDDTRFPIFYPDLRLECKLATLPFERRGNYPCQISLVKAIRVRVRSLPTPWRTRPGSLSSYSRPKCKPFAERAGGILRPTNQGPQALKFGTKEGKLVSRSSVQHSRSTTSSRWPSSTEALREVSPQAQESKTLTHLRQSAAISFRTIKFWSGFAGD